MEVGRTCFVATRADGTVVTDQEIINEWKVCAWEFHIEYIIIV